jgi:hypothetical protein
VDVHAHVLLDDTYKLLAHWPGRACNDFVVVTRLEWLVKQIHINVLVPHTVYFSTFDVHTRELVTILSKHSNTFKNKTTLF